MLLCNNPVYNWRGILEPTLPLKKRRLVFPWSTLQSSNYFQLYTVVSFKLHKLHPFSLLKGNFIFGGRLSEDQFIYCNYYLLMKVLII